MLKEVLRKYKSAVQIIFALAYAFGPALLEELRDRWKAISPKVLKAAFNTTPEMEKFFRSKYLDSEMLFAPNMKVVNWPVSYQFLGK
jgi:hypothetical protein